MICNDASDKPPLLSFPYSVWERATMLQRGVEWAATGKVTQKVPENFPAEAAVSARP